jgi:hypothetical protein
MMRFKRRLEVEKGTGGKEKKKMEQVPVGKMSGRDVLSDG